MNHPLTEKGKGLLLVLAVAAPMAYVMQISMGIWLPAWIAVGISIVALVLIELAATNKFTAIGTASAVLLLPLLVWAVLTKDQREVFIDFFWWALYFLGGGGEYPLGYGLALTAITTFLIALYTWLFGRKFFYFPMVMLFVVGFLLFKWFHGLDPVLFPGVFAVAGLIALWAKSFQRKTEKKANRKLDSNGIALVVLPLALAITLGCYAAITTEQAAKWQNKQVYDLLERFNNYIADYTNFDRPRHTYSIARFGFMPMGTRLGGPVELSDEEMLHVKAEGSLLLRGAVYNKYTGQRWEDSTGSGQYRFRDDQNGLRQSVFDLTRPQLSEGDNEQFQRFVSTQEFTLVPVVDSSSALFTPYRGVTEVESLKFMGVLPRYNEKGELFSSGDLRAGYGYTVTAEYLDYNAAGFETLMDRLLGLGLTDTAQQADWVREKYLDLPTGIDQMVYVLANDLANGYKVTNLIYSNGELSGFDAIAGDGKPINDYEKALAIRDFLKSNFKYSLKPTTPPEHTDFVSWFIANTDEKDSIPSGYCTYYASAMAVMARIAGIPSRYCEGYAMPSKTNQDGVYVVRGNNAHAWAELYFEGIGWIPFDATPAADDTGDENTGVDTGMDPFPIPTKPPMEQEDTSQNELPDGNPLTWEDIAPYLWLLPVLMFAALLGWVVAKLIWARIRISNRYVLRKHNDHSKACAYYYSESLKLLEFYNYPLKTGETPAAYAIRIDRWLRLGSGSFGQVAALISRISYSDYTPVDEDLRFLSGFCRDLARYTYHAVGSWYYFLHRVMGVKQKVIAQKTR